MDLNNIYNFNFKFVGYGEKNKFYPYVV